MRIYFTIANLTVIWLASLGCSLLGPSLHLTPSAAMNCDTVQLPGEWWHADPELEKQAHTIIDLGHPQDEPEFRLVRTTPPEIVVAMRAVHSYGGLTSFYSSDKYAFRPGRPGTRTVDESSWNRAAVLQRGEKRYPTASDEFYRTDAKYQGKTFPRTGQFAYGSDISEHSRWIAVYSYDGKQTPKEGQREGSLVFPGRGPDPAKAILHIDLYSVGSRKKQGSLIGPFRGDPIDWYVLGSFVADRYYVIGTDGDQKYRKFLFCELPGIDSKK
jgi:hypothetical protein